MRPVSMRSQFVATCIVNIVSVFNGILWKIQLMPFWFHSKWPKTTEYSSLVSSTQVVSYNQMVFRAVKKGRMVLSWPVTWLVCQSLCWWDKNENVAENQRSAVLHSSTFAVQVLSTSVVTQYVDEWTCRGVCEATCICHHGRLSAVCVRMCVCAFNANFNLFFHFRLFSQFYFKCFFLWFVITIITSKWYQSIHTSKI